MLFSPLLWATFQEITSSKNKNLGNITSYSSHSSDLLQLFLPPAHQPWWGSNLSIWQSLNINSLHNFGSVFSYIALGLGIVALINFKGLWFWPVTGAIWLVLSLGAVLSFNDTNTGILLPGYWLNQLPVFNIIRFTERYFLMTQLSLAVLAGFGLVFILNRVKNQKPNRNMLAYGVGVVILALCFFEQWPGFVSPSEPLTVPAFTQIVSMDNAASGVDPAKAIFEMPVTKHGTFDSWRMYYQIFHHRPIFGGYLSRDPLDYYRTGDFVLSEWVDPPLTAEPNIIPTRTALQKVGLLNYFNIGYIVLYPKDYNGNTANFNNAKNLVTQTFSQVQNQPAQPVYQDDLAIVYKVPQLGLTEPVEILGHGWANSEAIDKQNKIYQRWLDVTFSDSEISVVIPASAPATQAYTLDFKVASPDKPRHLQIFVNDQKFGDLTVNPGTNEIKLPSLPLKKGENQIRFKPDPADGFYIPSEHSTTTDSRNLTLAFISIQVLAS